MEQDIRKNNHLKLFLQMSRSVPRSYYNLTNKNNHLKLFFIIDIYMSPGNGTRHS